jgi:hypothetical protein
MRIFEIKSDKFTGAVMLKFNDDGKFCSIDFSGSGVSYDQMVWFLRHLPKTADEIKCYSGTTFVEILDSVTFDAFWNKYDDKARSSKVKTKRVWDKMSRAEQVKAYNYIERYVRNIPPTVCKKYATTYLNDQLWNN